MAKYDKETKFYWLQLKEDFFEDDAIEWLEEQKPNGRDYAYFYLKLCLKSLKSNGVLIRQVGNILIPYDNQKLAELTKMDFDTVTVAMELLKKIGLVQVLENGEIYVTQLENLIGSKSMGALKKQQQRLLGGQKVDNCPPEIELKDRDRDRFKKPTLKEIEDYIKENNYSNVDPYVFYDYFTKTNWIDSKGNKVKNWKGKIITWNSYDKKTTSETLPDWFDKDIETKDISNNEQQEIQGILDSFR